MAIQLERGGGAVKAISGETFFAASLNHDFIFLNVIGEYTHLGDNL